MENYAFLSAIMRIKDVKRLFTDMRMLVHFSEVSRVHPYFVFLFTPRGKRSEHEEAIVLVLIFKNSLAVMPYTSISHSSFCHTYLYLLSRFTNIATPVFSMPINEMQLVVRFNLGLFAFFSR